MITIYSHKRLSGKRLFYENSFKPSLDLFCSLLDKYAINCVVTSSWRWDTNVAGAIVTPAKMSNHLIGHAFDFNLIDKDKKYWNSVALKSPTGDVKRLLDEVDASPILRWGGAFKVKDSVHVDDGLNILDPLRWASIYNEIHLSMEKAVT